MNDTICLVTGANSGIGLETARSLAQQGATVIMTARSIERGEAALAEVRQSTGSSQVSLLHLDLADLASIRAAAEAFSTEHDRLDVLVNNAGLMLGDRRETADGFEMTFGVNHLGHFAFTLLLLPRIEAAAPSRIVNVSSAAHKAARSGLDLDDLMFTRRSYSPMAAYSASKLANIHFTRELARRLEGRGVSVNALHPGVVGSRFASDGDFKGLFSNLYGFARPFMLTPAKGARTSLHVATSEEGGQVSGAYFARKRQARVSRAAQDDDSARALWTLSEALTGVSI
ncbi:MAG: SDR family oxidoreductase [Myxococcota bacterium]|nr:SDR family oxidoreductase [Myxococcota bacterium]